MREGGERVLILLVSYSSWLLLRSIISCTTPLIVCVPTPLIVCVPTTLMLISLTLPPVVGRAVWGGCRLHLERGMLAAARGASLSRPGSSRYKSARPDEQDRGGRPGSRAQKGNRGAYYSRKEAPTPVERADVGRYPICLHPTMGADGRYQPCRPRAVCGLELFCYWRVG